MALIKARVVAKTVPLVEGLDTIEDFIAYTARVSNPSNQMNTMTGPKLLQFLTDENHWSPYEMANIVVEVETTRDISRQLLRHRSFSFQEFSQRYAYTKALDYTFEDVVRETRIQDTKNRQNSLPTEDYHKHLIDDFEAYQNEVFELALKGYKYCLDRHVAKEQARALLPEGLTPSRLYVNGNLRSWIHYIDLRSGHGTQKEHMEIAEKCRDIFKEQFPIISEALEWN